MRTTALAYYTAHDSITAPGEHANLFAGLSPDPDVLHSVLHGVLIHLWQARQQHPELVTPTSVDVFTRHTRHLLAHLRDHNPFTLTTARAVDQRLVVDCRHFVVLQASILRHYGVPARARCGFATYLEDTHYEDHWLCEYWDSSMQRWVMDDPDVQRHDVSPIQFFTGARAWQLCRQNTTLGQQFGFGPELRGMWVARVNLVRDFAALNGYASVTGDSWGIAMKDEADLTKDEIALLDEAARLTTMDDRLAEQQVLYATNEALRAPTLMPNYDHVITNEWRTVAWEQEP